MPRKIIGVAPPSPTDQLVQALVRELTAPGDGPQPLIIERPIPGTGSRHVWVIWDRWRNFSDKERTEIIIQAYTWAEGPLKARNITIALGVEPRAAILIGLLPFLVCAPHPHFMERSDYREAQAQEGRNTVLGDKTRELRYPFEEDALLAVERLKQSHPQTEWIIRRDEEDSEE